MPEPEPIEAPAVKPGAFKLSHLIGGAVVAVTLFGGGIALGVWFTTHYRVVPISQNPVLPRATSPAGSFLPTPAPTPAASPAAIKNGPFTFRFTPGEDVKYRFNAAITGGGIELGSSAPVNMKMSSALRLHTDAVSPGGTGSLALTFDDTRLAGGFMGNNFSMHTGASGTNVRSGNRDTIDTAKGIGSAQNIPQLDFFNTPIHMKVARNGEVSQLSGPSGIESIISPLPALTEIEFPRPTLDQGTQWTSRFNLPVPGFGDAARGEIINTFKGYVTYAGRHCGVIEQRITSSQDNGKINSPKSSLGDAMSFTMPHFDVDGTSIVYFDVDDGKLVRDDLNMNLKLDLGQSLGGAGQLLQGFLSQLGQAGGPDLPEFQDLAKKAKKTPDDLLKLNLKVDASISLVDSPGPARLRGDGRMPDR